VFAESARRAGATVIALDCRTIEPTESGFLFSLARAIGSPGASLDDVADRLTVIGVRVVLTLDAYEVFRFFDTWLRETFIPVLGTNVRVVVAGREPPVLAWLSTPRWQGQVQTVALDSLGEREASEFLEMNAISAGDAQRINRFAHGNPLALKLAAATVADHPDISLEGEAIPRVVDALARLYLTDVDDPITRRSLIAASVVRRVTKSLLRAMVSEAAPEDAFDRLATLPFVVGASDGLVIHDAVREAIGAHTRAVDPEGYRNLRRSAWHQLRDEVQTAGPAELWRYTADVLYLLENPVIREAFFPSGGPSFTVHAATQADHEAIAAIVAKHEGPDGQRLLQRWLEARPESFTVAKDSLGVVGGFYAMFLRSESDATLIDEDPLTRGWQAHLTANPLPRDQTALFIRYMLAESDGEMPSAARAACLIDVKRTYMALRPRLRRVYLAQRPPAQAAYQAMTDQLGFVSCGTAWMDETYHLNVNDFGAESVDGWLAGLVAAELGIEPDRILDKASHELVLGPRRLPLTRLEFSLLEYLVDREGQAVSREALIRDVWGHSFSGGSNVIEAVVRSIRRKLGDRADCIVTVSGVGYRYRINPPA
jgi:hypothetical protein